MCCIIIGLSKHALSVIFVKSKKDFQICYWNFAILMLPSSLSASARQCFTATLWDNFIFSSLLIKLLTYNQNFETFGNLKEMANTFSFYTNLMYSEINKKSFDANKAQLQKDIQSLITVYCIFWLFRSNRTLCILWKFWFLIAFLLFSK